MSLRVELNKELEKKFRELAMKKYGYSKGSIKKATETALKRWSEEVKKEKFGRKEDVIIKSLKLLETGVGTKNWKFNRSEIYEERFKKSFKK